MDNIIAYDRARTANNTTLTTVSGKCDTISNKVDTATTNINTVGSKVDAANTSINTLGESINTVNTNVVNTKGVVDTINTNTANTKSVVDTVNTNVSSVKTTVSSNGSKLDALTTNVNSIKTMVTTQSTGMSMVKRILRGISYIDAGNRSVTVTLSTTIDASKSFIVISGGVANRKDSSSIGSIYCSELTNTTATFSFQEPSDGKPSIATYFTWQVIEFN